MCDVLDDDVERDIEDSGPWCRHWGDPGDCDELCKCGHTCTEHDYHDNECTVDGCDCEEFEDAD